MYTFCVIEVNWSPVERYSLKYVDAFWNISVVDENWDVIVWEIVFNSSIPDELES